MAKLTSLAKMVKLAQQNEVAEQFVNDLLYTIESEDKEHNTYKPTQSFKPSAISGCLRCLFYEVSGATKDEESKGTNLVGICESGTDRHETIQNYIQAMSKHGIDCEWVNVGDYLKQQGITDPQVIKQVGNETKLYSVEYNMRFMCDGLIKYNGEYYIIEIKTESTHKYGKHSDAWDSHKLQATCYSMTIGVPNVIFIYENRDNCDKKGFLVEVTDTMINQVKYKINTVNKSIQDNTVPPRETDKCTYCNYKTQCRKDGN